MLDHESRIAREPLCDKGTMALLGSGLHAQERRTRALHRRLDFAEYVGRAREVLRVKREATLRIALQIAVRITRGSKVNVFDAVLAELGRQRRLGETRAAREWQSSDIHDSRGTRARQ